ncbi:MAG TPA: UDP-glucose 4-epimerase GalE [Polyangiaceae bacterium]|nr:UDP-glucose 4-epimerase GalE [Polyangiaceae bacterium]
MKILVTGGAGYVGSACLRYVVSKGHEALAYDNLVEGHSAAVGKNRLIVGDIAETAKLTAVLKEFKADAVMHFAAATCVGESVDNPEYHYRNNIGGTLSLLNAMKEAGVKRMLFSSTCATYGLSPVVPMTEETAQDPCSPYARTKLAVEWMIRDFSHAYGLGFTLLRYFNASGASPGGKYGEYHHPETHLIPIVLACALGQRKEVAIYGKDYPTPDGTCIRDYIHVDDLASAHLLAIEKTSLETKEVFNVGTGTGQSVLEVVKACETVVGRPIPQKDAPRRPGDPPALVAEPKKLKTQLGWVPKYTSIVDTVRTAWEFHQNHPDGYAGPRNPA